MTTKKTWLSSSLSRPWTLAKEAEAPADAYTSDMIKGLRISAGPAKGAKCGRCWMYQESVGTVKDHPEICGRCAGNL